MSKFRFELKSLLMILVLLFSIGIVSATLNVKDIVSSSGTPGYRAANDTIGINVSSTSDVSIGGGSCTKQGDITYICTVTDVAVTAVMTYQLNNSEGDTASRTIKVDNNIGAVSFTIENDQNGVLLNYNIQDLGFNTMNNACSGIASISVYDNTNMLNTIALDGTPGTCTYTGSINLSIAASGTKSIYLVVEDNVGNSKSTPPQNISIDISAPEIINGLEVKRAGSDEDLTVIGGSSSFLVDMYFSIREDNLASIILDLTGANTNPAIQYAYKDFSLPLSNCDINTSSSDNSGTSGSSKVYDCVIRNVPLGLTTGNLDMTVTATDTLGNVGTAVLSKTFTIDSVEPQVTSIKTDHCDTQGKCYIKSGQNNITINLNKQNFDHKYVFFNIPDTTLGINMVQSCTGGVCTAIIPLTCTDSQVELSIVGSSGFESQDDAGNVIAPYSTYLYCDNTAPTITNISVTGDSSNSVIKDLLVSGSTITISADVIETDSNELTATAYLDLMKNSTEPGKCTRIDNTKFNCIWSISNINPGVYTANILLNVSDTAGNINSRSYSQKVYGYKSDNETPDNLQIKFRDVAPTEINRIVVDMASTNQIDYYVYARYDLSVAPGKKDAEVKHQQVDISKCKYISESGTLPANIIFSDATITNAYAKIDEIGRIDFKFANGIDPNSLADEFTISCNISAMVKEGDYIFRKTQELQLDIPFKMVNTKLCTEGQECTPGVALGKKLEKAEKSFLVKAKWMGVINTYIPKIQKICDLRGRIAQGTNTAVMLSMIGSGVSVMTGNIKFGNIPLQLAMQLGGLDACFAGTSSTGNYGNSQIIPIPSGDIVNAASVSTTATQAGVDAMQAQEKAKRDASSGILSGLFNMNQENRQKIATACKKMVTGACDFLTCSKTDSATGITSGIVEASKGMSIKGSAGGLLDSSATTGNALPDLFNGAGGFAGQSMDILKKNIQVPDVRNSIIMAGATGCWPAVYYNLNKYRQVDCNYVYCLKMASYTGTDVSACDGAKHAQICSIIVGEAFELPGANIIKNLAENAADYVQNFFPLAGASILKQTLCPNDVPAPLAGADILKAGKVELPTTIPQQTFRIYGCQLPLAIARFADVNMRSSQRGQFTYPETPDMCAYADCIGQANCKYEPDFFTTINKIQLPAPNNKSNINTDKNKQTADSNLNQKNLERLAYLEKLKQANDGKLSDADKKEYDGLYASVSAAGYLPKDYWTEVPAAVTENVQKINTQIAADKLQADTAGAKLAPKVGEMYTPGSYAFTADDSKSLANLPETITAAKSGIESNTAELKKLQSTDPLGTDRVRYNTLNIAWVTPLDEEEKTTLAAMNAKIAANDANIATTKQAIAMDTNTVAMGTDLQTYLTAKKDIADQQALLGKSKPEDVEQHNIDLIYAAQKSYSDCMQKTGATAKDCVNKAFDAKGVVAAQNSVLMHNALTMPQADYNNLELDKKLDVDTLRENAYARLEYIDNQISPEKYNSKNPDLPLNPSDPNSDTPASLLKERAGLLRDMKLCSDTDPNLDTCDQFNKALSDITTGKSYMDAINGEIKTQSTTLTASIKKTQSAIRAYKTADTVGTGIFMGLQWLNANNMIRFMFTGYWTNKMFGVDVSNLLDFDKYKESLCNPANPINLGSSSDENTVISCTSGYCQPVLTYSAERTELQYPNGTKYNVYTTVYYLSGGDVRGRNITYQIHLISSSGARELYAYKNPQQVIPFDIVQKKTAFKSSREYNTMCIEFSEKFPPDNSLNNARTYCRTIVDSGFGSAINNGAPYPMNITDATNAETDYVNEYDDQGNRIRASGPNTIDNRPPGFFEK